MNYDRYGKDPKLTAFIDAIAEACQTHGMSLAREDRAPFIVEDFSEANIDWLRAAHDDRTPMADQTPDTDQTTQE